MLEPLHFRAARGLVKSAYRRAAELTECVVLIDRTTHRASLAGKIDGKADAYLLQQSGLVFVIPTKVSACRWPVESLTVSGDQVSARLGVRLE